MILLSAYDAIRPSRPAEVENDKEHVASKKQFQLHLRDLNLIPKPPKRTVYLRCYARLITAKINEVTTPTVVVTRAIIHNMYM